MTTLRWLIAVAACVAATGCSDRQGREAHTEHRRPDQAGLPIQPRTAAEPLTENVAELSGER